MAHTTLSTVRTTRRLLILAVLFMLGALLVYGYMFYILQSTSTKAALLEAENAALAKREASISDIRNDLATVTESRVSLNSYIIDAADIVPFLETIEAYGRTAGVATVFETVALSETNTSLSVAVRAEGEFPALYKFVALVEAAPYEVSIQSAQIESQVATELTAPPAGSEQPVQEKNWSIRMGLLVNSVTAKK